MNVVGASPRVFKNFVSPTDHSRESEEVHLVLEQLVEILNKIVPITHPLQILFILRAIVKHSSI